VESGVRQRLLSAIVVGGAEHARRLLVERLIAAGFVVEWVTTAEEARTRVRRCDPDVVVIVEQHAGDGLTSAVAAVGAGEAIQHPRVVVTIDGSMGGSPAGRRITVIQWRDTGREFSDVVRSIMDAASARR
jgi:hypothetical protein